MTLEDIIKKSQAICEQQKYCTACPLSKMTCIDKRGKIEANTTTSLQTPAEGLIKLKDYLEKQEKKGKSKK